MQEVAEDRRSPVMRRFAIAILALCGLAATVLIIFNFFPRLMSSVFLAKQMEDVRRAHEISQCVSLYLADNQKNQVPAGFSLQMLAAGNAPYLTPAYLTDAYGRPFTIEVPGRNGAHFSIVSLGKDGVVGGTGDNQDIVADTTIVPSK